MLPVALDCPFLIAPSVYSNVSFRSVSCVPGVAIFSGLSFLIASSVFANVYFRSVASFSGLSFFD
jgi:hypothetical protein